MISCCRVIHCCNNCTSYTTLNPSEPQAYGATCWTTALRVSHANLHVDPKIDPLTAGSICADSRVYLQFCLIMVLGTALKAVLKVSSYLLRDTCFQGNTLSIEIIFRLQVRQNVDQQENAKIQGLFA